MDGLVLTHAGLLLLAKAQTGVTLHFSRVAIGDGALPDGQELQSLTALISTKMNLPIESILVDGGGESLVRCRVQNAQLEEGFFFRETGLFAQDPDVGEILYAVENRGDKVTFIPSCNGSRSIDYIYNLIIAIGQAQQVSATINSSLVYALNIDFLNHIHDQSNPHEEWLKVLPATSTPSHLWAQTASDGQLHPIAIDTVKQTILGGDGTDITILRGRVNQTERELANMALRLEAENIYPDYNALIAEDFTDPDLVDQFACAITSIVAGDDSVDVETLVGIVPGAWYTISDGVYQERCQIKSVVKNGSTYRLIMQTEIQHTYVSGQTNLYRSTAEIQTAAGLAEGAGDRKTALWAPALVWTGTNANTTTAVPLVTTTGNSAAFTASGDIGYTADGAVTLV